MDKHRYCQAQEGAHSPGTTEPPRTTVKSLRSAGADHRTVKHCHTDPLAPSTAGEPWPTAPERCHSPPSLLPQALLTPLAPLRPPVSPRPPASAMQVPSIWGILLVGLTPAPSLNHTFLHPLSSRLNSQLTEETVRWDQQTAAGPGQHLWWREDVGSRFLRKRMRALVKQLRA